MAAGAAVGVVVQMALAMEPMRTTTVVPPVVPQGFLLALVGMAIAVVVVVVRLAMRREAVPMALAVVGVVVRTGTLFLAIRPTVSVAPAGVA
jgi:hypothetical protein